MLARHVLQLRPMLGIKHSSGRRECLRIRREDTEKVPSGRLVVAILLAHGCLILPSLRSFCHPQQSRYRWLLSLAGGTAAI
jgi:hypothetical protein